MIFWLFMLAMDLLNPCTMYVFGRRWTTGPPPERSNRSGYRTAQSMQSPDTWRFAHRYFGKLWMRFSLPMVPGTVLAMCLVLGQPVLTIAIWGGLICLLWGIVMVLPMPLTDLALKRSFSKDGKPLS